MVIRYAWSYIAHAVRSRDVHMHAVKCGRDKRNVQGAAGRSNGWQASMVDLEDLCMQGDGGSAWSLETGLQGWQNHRDVELLGIDGI